MDNNFAILRTEKLKILAILVDHLHIIFVILKRPMLMLIEQ